MGLKLIDGIIATTKGFEGKNLHYKKLASIIINSNEQDYTTIYQSIVPTLIYAFMFEISSNKINIQLEFDNNLIFTNEGLNLDKLGKLRFNSFNTQFDAAKALGFNQFHINKWVYLPPEPIFCKNSIILKMKSIDDNQYKLEEGLMLSRTIEL